MGIPDPHRGSQVQRQGASKAADYYAEKFLLFRNSANTLTKRGGLRLILPSWRSCCGGHRHQKLVSATNRAENRTRASVHNATRGASYALVHACAVRSCRADRDSCALCGVPSGSLSVSAPHNLAKRKAAEAVIRSVELILQADAHDVAGEMCVAGSGSRPSGRY